MIDYKNLKISFESIITKNVSNHIKEILPDLQLVLHIPAKRIEVTFILMFALLPHKMVLLLTPEVKVEFFKEFKKFVKWHNKYFNLKMPELKFYNIESPESKIFENFNIKYYSKLLWKILNNENIKLNVQNEVLVDLTGGTKLHSVLLYDFALKNKFPFSYLYTREIKKEKGIFAIPGEEKLFIKLPQISGVNLISIDKFVDVNLKLKDKSFVLDLKLNNKTYEKIIPVNLKEITMLKNTLEKIYEETSTFILFKKRKDILYKMKNISEKFLKKFFPENFLKIAENYKYFKFYFDKNSYFLPVDFFLYYERNAFCVRDFIFDFSNFPLVKNEGLKRSYTKKMLILINYKNKFEKKLFLKEGKYIKSIASKNNINVQINVNLTPSEFISQIKMGWDIVHFVGHTGFDSKGSFFECEKGKVYAKEISFKVSDIFFSNSCNSSPLIKVKVNKSFPYNFLKYGGKTFIGTFWEIDSEDAYNFALCFYEKFLQGISSGSAFFNTVQEYSKYNFIPANYHIYGDVFYNLK